MCKNRFSPYYFPLLLNYNNFHQLTVPFGWLCSNFSKCRTSLIHWFLSSFHACTLQGITSFMTTYLHLNALLPHYYIQRNWIVYICKKNEMGKFARYYKSQRISII
ncbi:hypothetical protein XENTR_v10011975 [Xenopus tropicalis]|nr:hypothetical protein XENTR_v10011975 [Xenopus tropicalis]